MSLPICPRPCPTVSRIMKSAWLWFGKRAARMPFDCVPDLELGWFRCLVALSKISDAVDKPLTSTINFPCPVSHRVPPRPGLGPHCASRVPPFKGGRADTLRPTHLGGPSGR